MAVLERKPGAKEMVHNRLSKDLIREIDHLAVEWDVYRADAVERLLNEAVQKYRDQGSLWPPRQQP